MVGYNRRRGAAQNQRGSGKRTAFFRHFVRGILRLMFASVGLFVLFVDDDQPQVLYGGKHRRARADDNPGFAG